ncbi:MAG: hypothetical protein AAFN44_07710 [Pseudomonadota bacterium]
MDILPHPSVHIIDAKYWIYKKKNELRAQHPDWPEKGIETVAEWEYFFSKWRSRFLKSIPYALVASIGVLTLFRDVIWFEPVLAMILSKWSSLAVDIFELVTFGFFKWIGLDIPGYIIDYLTVGIGLTGIWSKMVNDLQKIRVSMSEDDIDHLMYSSGLFGCFMWILYVPLISPVWPLLILVPILSMGSLALPKKWGVPRSKFVNIQIRRAVMFMNPFIVAVIVWALFAIIFYVF